MLYYRFLAILSAIALLLSSCGQPTQDPVVGTLAAEAAAQTVAAMVTASLRPTATETPTVTPTVTLTPVPTITPTPTVGPYGPGNYPSNINPLTGLVVPDPAMLARRPVLIKVANFPPSARPQAGLSQADIVFEYYIGGGSNRFAAIFYGDNAAQVGPIRSGRLVDSQITLMYQAVLGFSGAYQTVLSSIYSNLGGRAIAYSGSTCPALCRKPGDDTVNGVFANSKQMSELATSLGVNITDPQLGGLSFNQVPPAGGNPGSNLTVLYNIYNRGEWRYDVKTGKYLRWIESADNALTMEPLLDRNTNKQLAFTNVAVLFATYTEFAPTLHDIAIASNQAGQKAYVFRDGQVYLAVWKSAGADKPLQFFNQDGSPLALKHGNTWLAVVGVNSVVTEDTAGSWTAQFYLP